MNRSRLFKWLKISASAVDGVLCGLLLALCLMVQVPFAAEPEGRGEVLIEPESAIKTIEEQESRFHDLFWRVQFAEGIASGPIGPPWKLAKKTATLSADVMLEVGQGSYHVAVAFTGRRIKTTIPYPAQSAEYFPDTELLPHRDRDGDGTSVNTQIADPASAELIGQRAEYSFDGKLFRHWHQYGDNAEIPARNTEISGVSGEIDSEDAENLSGKGFLGEFGRPLAVHYMPPNFTLGMQKRPLRLSSQLRANLRNGKQCEIIDNGNGTWLIQPLGVKVQME